MKSRQTYLIDYLHTIFPKWKSEVPVLMDYVEELYLEESEPLPSQRGDIYFVSTGAIGKYDKKIPQRYILANELIIVPLQSKPFFFRALEDSTIMLLQRPNLYRIAQDYPLTIELYDQLRAEQEKSAGFRSMLLELPKGERLETFRTRFSQIIPLITRNELAQFLGVSREYLRRLF